MSQARSYPLNRKRLPGRAPYVVTALRRKYAELKGLRDTEAMGHVGATLLLFAPGEDLSSIATLRPYKGDRGRWSRTALSILRKAQPGGQGYYLFLANEGEPERTIEILATVVSDYAAGRLARLLEDRVLA